MLSLVKPTHARYLFPKIDQLIFHFCFHKDSIKGQLLDVLEEMIMVYNQKFIHCVAKPPF